MTDLVCVNCGRQMRPYRTPAGSYPGTVARGSADHCMSCVTARRKKANKPTPAPMPKLEPLPSESKRHTPMPDIPCVPLRTYLRPSTFKTFEAESKRRGITIGELLSLLADKAVRR